MMDENTRKSLAQLNRNFYENVGIDFSRTRATYWKGWQKILPYFHNVPSKTLRILDLACGNGRFGEFIHQNTENTLYTGLDTDTVLIQEAVSKGLHCKKLDVLEDISSVSEIYDFVFAFGFCHHLPSQKFRLQWFSSVAKLIKPGGFFIFSIWGFDMSEALSISDALKNSRLNISVSELEEGDCFLGWAHTTSVRYCHRYSEAEIQEILDTLRENKLSCIDDYYADGKFENSNHYFVLKSTL